MTEPITEYHCTLCTAFFFKKEYLDHHYTKFHKLEGKAIILDDNVISFLCWADEHNVDVQMLVMKQNGDSKIIRTRKELEDWFKEINGEEKK